MTHLLRKVSFSKWEINKERTPNDYTADAITGCTRTQKNTLSVWEAESKSFETEEVADLIVAMATTMDRPDSIDLVWLDGNTLQAQGIEVFKTEGHSKFKSVNDKHRDLSNLNHAKLAIVGQHIVSKLNEEHSFKKISRQELLVLVNKALLTGVKISLEDLGEKWQNPIIQLRGK